MFSQYFALAQCASPELVSLERDRMLTYRQVEPFLKKLRVPGGLSNMILVGVQHQQNLLDFKYGFCKKGGGFGAARPNAERSSPIEVMPFSIVDDGFELVTSRVKAIIQQDGKLS